MGAPLISKIDAYSETAFGRRDRKRVKDGSVRSGETYNALLPVPQTRMLFYRRHLAMPRFSVLLRLPIVMLLAHLYVGARLASAVSPAMAGVVLALFALSYVAILAGFFTRRSVGHTASDAIAWVGFLALGLFSWLFVLTVMRDALLLVAGLAALVMGTDVPALLRQGSAALVAAVALVAMAWGLAGARRQPRIVTVDVPVRGLPPALSGFTFVQISDLHVGPTIKQGYVDAVVEAVNAQMPDAVVLTGDLVDGSVANLGRHTARLGRLRARHGVYAVTGNHEYYSGAAQWVAEFRRLGLVVLMNQHVVLSHDEARVVVAGVTDFGAAAFDAAQASDPAAAIRGAPADAAVRVLLAHQPRSAPAAARSGFDLQLSGHTHGGQFWPWKYLVPLQQPYVAGLHRHDAMWVYVSRGTGYWGPPMRLGAPSEITRIRLQAA